MRTAKDKKLSVPVRAIHIDLKGMPPKMERLLQLLELYAASSYNAVLVEWEDMFPWQEPLLRSPYAYSKEEINAFAEKAANCRMEIIPLVHGKSFKAWEIPAFKRVGMDEFGYDCICRKQRNHL